MGCPHEPQPGPPGLWVGPGCSRAKVGFRPGSVRAKIIGVPGDVCRQARGQVCSERNKLADAWAQATKHSQRLFRSLDSYSRSVFARAEKDAQASTQYCSYVVRQQQPSNANLIIKESRAGKTCCRASAVAFSSLKRWTAARARACVFFDLRHCGGLGARALLVRAARRPAGWSRRLRAGYGTRNHDDGFFSTVLVVG